MANRSVYGIYRDREQAANAIEALHRAGYRRTDISALMPENPTPRDLAHEKDTKAPEGIAIGVALGVIIGGILGWLTGAGMPMPSALDWFTVAGPVMAALAGAGAGATAGGLIGGLTGLCVPEYVVRQYRGRVRNNGILLSVHCDDAEWVSRAQGILEATGGRHIASASEAPADFLKTSKPMRRRAA